MNENNKRTIAIGLYATSVLCCMLSFIMLLISFPVDLMVTKYYETPGELDKIVKDVYTNQKNFFEYIDYLESWGWKPLEEKIFILFLTVAFLIAIISLVVEIVNKFKNGCLCKKSINIVLLILTIFSLVSLIFGILIQSDANILKVSNLSGYVHEYLYEHIQIKGPVKLIPAIVLILFAFVSQCVAGGVKFISKTSKQSSDFEKAESVIFKNDKDKASVVNNFSSADPTEELIKYKKLLDAGVINQEEFDNKKSELLN